MFDGNDIQKILDTVERIGDCWIPRASGYAIRVGSEWRNLKSHQIMWMYANSSPVPLGMVVRHRCGRGSCCNPEHLTVGTQRENMWDATARYAMGVSTDQLATYEDLPDWVPPPLRGDPHRNRIDDRIKSLIVQGRKHGLTDDDFRQILEQNLV